MQQYSNSLNSQEQKFMFATVLGSILEYFDFLTFIFLSPVIASIFFPANVHLGVMYLFITLIVGYIARPIGGIIIGNLSDKFGRKPVYLYSMLIIAIPSLVIVFLPSFAEIGYAATFIIIFVRTLQNLSLSCEFPNSITFIAEKFKNTNYFFLCAWLIFGANFGIAVCSQLNHFLLKYTSHDFLMTYGWRIPFITSSILALVAFYMRRNTLESDEFLSNKSKDQPSPLKVLFKSYKLQIFCGTWVAFIIALSMAIFHLFLPRLLVDDFAFSLSTAVDISSIGALTIAIFSLFFANLTKYLNPTSIILFTGSGLVIALGVILFCDFDLSVKDNLTLIYLHLSVIILSIFLAGINGVFFGLLVNLFPAKVRCTAIAICYNIAYLLGTSLTPFWANWLLKLSGDFRYVIAVCLIISLSFFNIFKLKSEA